MEGAKSTVTFIFKNYGVEFEMSYDKWKELERMFQTSGFRIYGKGVQPSAHIEVIVTVPAESKQWIFYMEKTFVENLKYILAYDYDVGDYIARNALVEKLLNIL